MASVNLTNAIPVERKIPGREHFPVTKYPKRWYALRAAQLVGTILCLSTAAYAQAFWPRSKAAPLTIVTATSTFGVFAYYIVAQFIRPLSYNYWAVIALDAYLTIFWFASFVALISEVADDFATSNSGDQLHSAHGLAATIAFSAFEV
ncbi:hypothetical protein GQ53DRAFT_815072 [Thozetella sp. PMI_491]|nr:hypothetical protein GQ53DRAFT_815072 [Thozetella sp. PMI_491]